MITPEAVSWAKPRISQDAEVESILALEDNELICRHLAAFSEDPRAYIQATDFVKEYKKLFQHGSAVKSSPLPVKTVKTTVVKTVSSSQRSYKDEEDTALLFEESLLQGLTIEPPKTSFVKNKAQTAICGCMGLDHEVLRNCIMCGRIMCVKETDPACVFCGFGNLQKADKKRFQEYIEGPGYQDAVAMCQRLLNFDKDLASRTRVYDTQTDFYEERFNPWSSESQRHIAAVHAAKAQAVYNDPSKLLTTEARLQIDLEHMKLSMSDAQQEFLERQNRQMKAFLENENQTSKQQTSTAQTTSEPTFDLSEEIEAGRSILPKANWKVQEKQERAAEDKLDEDEGLGNVDETNVDQEFCQPMSKHVTDDGVCLTLHQPWASLIVYGIKRVEGRVWNTSYRGRLWIHAASVEPDEDCISQIESFYSTAYGPTCPPFPGNYPTKCLLGCVDLVDVVTSHRGLWDKYPWVVEVNDSPFKFILKNPQRLITPISMPGEHKLWKVPRPQAYYRSLYKTKFLKVKPLYIDPDDPISEVTQPPTATRTDQSEPSVSWELKRRFAKVRELLLRPAPSNINDTILLSVRKVHDLKRGCYSVSQAFSPQDGSLNVLIGAVCGSIEQRFSEKRSVWLSSVGQPNTRIAEYLQSISPVESVYATESVHPAIRQVTNQILDLVHDRQVEKIWSHSLGGPHTPPIDVLELQLFPQEEPLPRSLSTMGTPLVVIGLAGTNVFRTDGGDEVFMNPGDVIVVTKPDSCLQLNKSNLNPLDDYLSQCAVLCLRANVCLR